MSQSISEGDSLILVDIQSKVLILSLRRIPDWQNATCAYIERRYSTPARNGRSRWKGMAVSGVEITELMFPGCLYRYRR